jgi:hypothetical protein
MKNIVLFASIFVATGLLFTNIYNSLIDSKSWGSNIPDSIETARAYFKSVNPAKFFRIFSPINQILGLLVLILFWRLSPAIRIYLAIAVALYISGDVLTFLYFYPRNEIMFRTGQLADVETLRNAWREWTNMNWIRSLLVFMGLIFSFLSLHTIYTMK